MNRIYGLYYLHFLKLLIPHTKRSNLSCISKGTKNWKTGNNMYKSSVFNLHDASKEQVQEFLHSFDAVLTDCDGVLWCLCHDNAIPGSAETMDYFRKLGKKIFYVTNNSTRTRSQIVEKAKQLGFVVSQEEILSSSYLVAHYFKDMKFTKKAYIVGSNAIAEELKAVGVKHFGVGPDLMTEDDYRSYKPELETEVGAVVVGFDEHISYPKLVKAASYLSSEECLFIGTNCDAKVYKNASTVIPAAGTMIRAVEVCSSREANILGKPNPYVRKYIESYGLNPARTLMIGDNSDTDIEFGIRCGFQTLLVLSGITSAQDAEKIRSEKIPPLPDVVLTKLGDLLGLV